MSDLYYFGDQAMLKHGTEATPIPKVAADEIERLAAVLKDREAEIKSLSGHLIYSTDRIATMEEIIATHVGATIDDEETVAVILECYEKWLALQEDKNGSA